MDKHPSRFGIVAAVGSLLVAVIGAPAFAQDTSTPPSDAPAASGAPTQDPCARFRQDAPTSGAPRFASIALAQEQTEPDDPYACTLPAWDPGEAWPFAGRVDSDHAFHWSLPRTEGTDPEGDIIGVGWVPIRLNAKQARQVRNAKEFMTSGPVDRTIRDGDYVLIQIETAAVPKAGGDVNRGFHIATDSDDDPTNDVPGSVKSPDNPYQGLQNLYTFYQLAGREVPTLASTDFGSGKAGPDGSVYYNDDVRFAGRVTTSPAGVQFLVRKGAMGAGFRPIVIGPAPSGGSPLTGIASMVGTDLPGPVTLDQGDPVPIFPTGSDVGTMGTRLGLFPTNGQAEGAAGDFQLEVLHGPPPLAHQLSDADGDPLTTPCLSGSPLIWTRWLAFEDLDRIEDWFRDQGLGADGIAELPIRLRVVHDGTPVTQDTIVRLTLRGGNLWMGTIVCLTGYGSYQVTGIELAGLGTPVDEILADAVGAPPGLVPRWLVGEDEGRAAGGPPTELPPWWTDADEDFQRVVDFFLDAFKPPPR